MRDILEPIVKAKRDDLVSLKERIPESALIERSNNNAPRDFLAALKGDGISLIAELKKASPTAGVIRPEYNPVEIATGYEAAGAAAISVLTEEHYFQGSLTHLTAVRDAVSIPVLRKDFIIEDYQLYESAAAGADAALLIARLLTREELARMVELCYTLRISPLVEIYDEEDVGKAIASGAPILGINNRDLRSGKIDLSRTIALKKSLPMDRVIVSESGIKNAGDLDMLFKAGAHAALIGESLLKSEDPAQALAILRRGGEQIHG
ncbi:MAG: indole-3-glycerol phosphate synthase TrpC [bacterium]